MGMFRRRSQENLEKNKHIVPNQTLGPTIFADWGDKIEVTVINNLETNGYVFAFAWWDAQSGLTLTAHPSTGMVCTRRTPTFTTAPTA